MVLNVVIRKTKEGFIAVCEENRAFGHGKTVSEALEVLQTNLELFNILNDKQEISLNLVMYNEI